MTKEENELVKRMSLELGMNLNYCLAWPLQASYFSKPYISHP